MKYKVFGYGLVCFIILMVGFWLWPKEEMSWSLFVDTNIDSIRISKSKNDFTITSRDNIASISKQLKQGKKINALKCQRCFTEFYELNMHMKGKNKPILLRISTTEYDGIVLHVGDLYYHAEILDGLIKNLRGQ